MHSRTWRNIAIALIDRDSGSQGSMSGTVVCNDSDIQVWDAEKTKNAPQLSPALWCAGRDTT